MAAGVLFRFLLGMLVAVPAAADVAVVVNRDSLVQSLSAREVSDLYLGRSRALPSIGNVVPFEHLRDSPVRDRFFRNLNGMTLKQINAYWARLQFSGEVLPPPVFPDSRALINALRANPNAIGYVDASDVDASVRVVLQLPGS